MTDRYARQLALDEITPEKQEALAKSRILMIGVGGLGSASLPYLAGAGVGNIYLADHDRIDITNLHRQTIYRTDQEGRVKSTMAGAYLQELNPQINVYTIDKQVTESNAAEIVARHSPDLLLDGSDNFATKILMNDISVELKIPLICASITEFEGQIGTYEGYKNDMPCYRCVFPELSNVSNFPVVGPLGTCAGIIGVMQAHIALCRLLDIKLGHDVNDRAFTRVDLKSLETKHYKVTKDPKCPCCRF